MANTIADKLGKAANVAAGGMHAAANKIADKVLDAKKTLTTQGKVPGKVGRDFKFKGNIEVYADFCCPFEITDPNAAGWGHQLIQYGNAFLSNRIDTLTKAVKDLDQKLEKMKKENKAEELKKFSSLCQAQVNDFINRTKAELPGVIEEWWVQKHKKDRELLKYQVQVVGKVSVTIGVAALGAGAGITSAVVTGGGAAPIAAAAVSGAVSVATTSVTQLQAALKGFHDAYVKLDAAYHKAKIEAEKQKLLGPGNPDLKKRILAFVKTNPMKELEGALSLYEVMVAKADEKLAAFTTEGTKLADKCEAMLKEAEGAKDPKKKQEAQKAVEAFERTFRKSDVLAHEMERAKGIAAKAKKMIAEAKEGKAVQLGGLVIDKIEDFAPAFQTAASAISDIKQIAESLAKVVH